MRRKRRSAVLDILKEARAMFYRDVLIESRERNAFMSKELQIRNSTVDFLVFTRDAGEDGIEVRVQNGDVWLTQKAISQLFDVDRSVITKHLSNIFKEGELDENSVCAKFAQTADDGKTYNYKFYSLAAIAKEFAESEFEKYRVIQDSLYESDFDKLMNDMEKNDAIN